MVELYTENDGGGIRYGTVGKIIDRDTVLVTWYQVPSSRLANYDYSFDDAETKTSQIKKITRPQYKAGCNRYAASVKEEAATKVVAITPEVGLIKRFLNWHLDAAGKTESTILAYFRALQKYIVSKQQKRNNLEHPDALDDIQKIIIREGNEYDGNGPIHFRLGDDLLYQLTAIVGGERVYKSLTVLRKFINFGGTERTREAIDKLLLEAQQVRVANNPDPFREQLAEVIAHLKGTKPGHQKFAEVELGGLQGLFDGLAGLGCFVHDNEREGGKK